MDWGRVDELIAGRYIAAQKHPGADLWIYNYTPRGQFDNVWTPETRACRGLIADGNRQIVARPFEKFFGIELYPNLPAEPFDVFEKVDGSLGVLYWHAGQPWLATRGSFTGPQTVEANQILRERYGHVRFDPSLTYLFEIVYPANRVVVDYGPRRDLVLLAILETATGRELRELPDLGMPTVQRHEGLDLPAILAMNLPNQEGFVMRFQSGLRVKVKFADYKRLHKLLTGVNERHLWEALKTGHFEEMVDRVPDEFFQWARSIRDGLEGQCRAIEVKCEADFRDLGDRRATAEYFKTCRYPSILFAMLDKKPYAETIWKLIYPASSETFKVDWDG